MVELHLSIEGIGMRVMGARGVYLFVVLFFCLPATALEASPDELATAGQWVTAQLEGCQCVWQPDPGIEIVANPAPVQKNGRFGQRLRLGFLDFGRGLFCHAPSRLIVRLPGPGKALSARAGVVVKEHTAGSEGSVVFTVAVAGQERFRSGVLHGTPPGVPVEVDLRSAGMVQVLRRAARIYTGVALALHGLDPGAQYTVTNREDNRAFDLGGSQLLEQGLEVSMPPRPNAKVFV